MTKARGVKNDETAKRLFDAIIEGKTISLTANCSNRATIVARFEQSGGKGFEQIEGKGFEGFGV